MFKGIQKFLGNIVHDIKEIRLDDKVNKFLSDGLYFPEKIPRAIKKTEKFDGVTYNFVSLPDGRRAVGMVGKDMATVQIIQKDSNKDEFVEVRTRRFKEPVYKFIDRTFMNI